MYIAHSINLNFVQDVTSRVTTVNGNDKQAIQKHWRGSLERAVRKDCRLPFLRNLILYSVAQNAELFALTYGALVVQLIQDYEDYDEVNNQLEKMGYNIGTRLIEDFLAKSGMGRCADFREVGEVVSKVRAPLLVVTFATYG